MPLKLKGEKMTNAEKNLIIDKLLRDHNNSWKEVLSTLVGRAEEDSMALVSMANTIEAQGKQIASLKERIAVYEPTPQHWWKILYDETMSEPSAANPKAAEDE